MVASAAALALATWGLATWLRRVSRRPPPSSGARYREDLALVAVVYHVVAVVLAVGLVAVPLITYAAGREMFWER